jgi:hypothetical protein
MKIHPVAAEFFRADRQADMMKLIVTSRNFANAPIKTINISIIFTFLSRTNILDADAICLVVLFFTIPPSFRILVPPLLLQLFQFPFVQKLQNSVK